mmetsp:Transcript_26679/g.62540  ORF Transcript_26679/g.62540 Transcript_26679/m.62540 type:complete len:133 (+) Transcript_26679:3-401(+)
MPELTASLSRSEARRRREEQQALEHGAAGWRAGGLMVYGADGADSAGRSRSPRGREQVERLARNFAPTAQEAAGSGDQKSAIQKARESKEKEREKARLKKQAREEEEREKALLKEQQKKEKQEAKTEKVKRY